MPRPTARGSGLLAVAGGAYVAARLLGTWELYLLAVAFTAAVLVSWALVALTSRRVAIVRSLSPEQPMARDELLLRFRVDRASRLPGLQMSLPDATGDLGGRPEGLEFDSLGPRRTAVTTAGPWPARRGLHRLPPLTAVAEDPLGLVRVTRRLAGPLEFVVYPLLVHVSSCPLLGGDGQLLHSTRGLPASGSSEFRGIRPYYPGEPLNHVDWKATARTGELMLRELDDPASGDVTVLLSGSDGQVTGTEPETSFELAVEAAGAVAAYALRVGRHITLLRCDRDWRRTRLAPDSEGRQRLLDALARVQPHAPLRLGPSLRSLLGGGARRARTKLLVLVTLTLDRELVRALIALRREGLDIAVLAVDAASFGAAPHDAASHPPRGASLDDGDADLPALLLSLESAGIRSLRLRRGDDLDAALALWTAAPRRRTGVPS